MMDLKHMCLAVFAAGIIGILVIRDEINNILRYTVDPGERKRRNRESNFLEKFTMSPYYDAAPPIFFIWYYVHMALTVIWPALLCVLAHYGCSPDTLDKLFKGFLFVPFGLMILYNLFFVDGFRSPGPPRWNYRKYKVRRKK